MSNFLKHLAFSILKYFGVWAKKVPNQTQLNYLLMLMKPIQTEHRLIRVGANTDGGYLLPDDLIGINCCLSPGVDITATFEMNLSEVGIPSYLLDYSVEDSPVFNHRFSFRKNYLGAHDHAEFISLKTWLKDIKESPDYLFQMDIEGYEYEVLESMSDEEFLKFRIMVIEFHSLSNIVNPYFYRDYLKILKRILNNFYIVHTHLNNSNDKVYKYRGEFIPRTAEITFLRKDRVKIIKGWSVLPNSSDYPNNPNNPDYPLPKIWMNKTELHTYLDNHSLYQLDNSE